MEVIFAIATNPFGRLPNILKSKSPPVPPPSSSTEPILRIGILGAAKIVPDGIVLPARNHPSVQLVAIAARDKSRAEVFAKQHGIARVLDSYADVVTDPDVDAVYIPLPNGLHHKWAIEALRNGKHILLEKPSCSNADQTSQVFALAKQRNLVALEAFHYRFHPALHLFGHLVRMATNEGTNPLTRVEADFRVVGAGIPEDDFRFTHALAGGSVTDPGVYPICISLYTVRAAAGPPAHGGTLDFLDWSSRIECSQAKPTLFVPRVEPLTTAHLDPSGKNAIDERMDATLLVPLPGASEDAPTVACTLLSTLRDEVETTIAGITFRTARLSTPTVEAVFKDGTKVRYVGYLAPWVYHSITVTQPSGRKATHQAYAPSPEPTSDAPDGFWNTEDGAGAGIKPEAWWPTYRYQLEVFYQAWRAHTHSTSPATTNNPTTPPPVPPPVWMHADESIAVMQCVDKIYEASGLGKRI
ncbi:hypothetical protein M427DRAFT_112422 [Gonapodya prolifera JEL478]|uniref:D-xylose 1-dehydrogenase (NADP(+), D-xylono-1,5-lactone-forming) n=1 Tax=Gonapodya prolifera (strain JEL478) TaxID=1344416 RepID=A0A139AD98_GONPJ|nr:hypothetical protein M427DRAFT_112422 [Gonapodya prolifera JEL478]|eukprot:KXS14728.1 hypothetical protein M427DRAFT_112422 [Gonapodya prolifera JEL478]